MKRPVGVLAIVFAISSAGYAAAQQPIPAGTYISEKAPGEQISVHGTQMKFHIRVNDRIVDHTYDYSVVSDGSIHLSPQVSSEILLGVPRYRWLWDGKAIFQHEPKTGEAVKFQKR